MMPIKVLFVDDKKEHFELMERVFSMSDYFVLVNKEPIFDESSRSFLTRDKQKEKIKELLTRENYEIILFDLSLRSDIEENYRAGEAKNFLSVEIYNEMKEWLKAAGKKFIFTTSHASWKEEEQFKAIGENVKGACYLRKPIKEHEIRVACLGYDQSGESKCGEKFQYCEKGICFNKVLRRMACNE